MNTLFDCFGDYSCWNSRIDCSESNDLSECIIECVGNYSCSGDITIDQLYAQIIDISCNSTNSCTDLSIDCMNNNGIKINSQCLLTCNDTESCVGLEIDGENVMNMNISCIGDKSCYLMEADCPSIMKSECLIECGMYKGNGTHQCYMAQLSGSNSWNFTVNINNNYSCEQCTISGTANMNFDFMDLSQSTDYNYDYNISQGFYWMNISINGMYGLYNADIYGRKRDKIYIKCNNHSSCTNVNWYLNAFSVGDIYCDKDKKNTCLDGKYYCSNYILNDRQCIDNGVVFTCDDNDLDCDDIIAFDIIYPTPNPTKQPTITVSTMDNTENVTNDTNGPNLWYLTFILITRSIFFN